MDDLIAHLKTLAPVAEAIVYITRQGSQVEALGKRLSQQETDLQTGEERLAEIERLCQIARTGAEEARASVIEAQGKIEMWTSGAKAEANGLIAGAKIHAEAETDKIRKAFVAEHTELQTKISQAKHMLAVVTEELKAKQADHDTVMASIASLKARLGAA